MGFPPLREGGGADGVSSDIGRVFRGSLVPRFGCHDGRREVEWSDLQSADRSIVVACPGLELESWSRDAESLYDSGI